jgi:hypothetical protein
VENTNNMVQFIADFQQNKEIQNLNKNQIKGKAELNLNQINSRERINIENKMLEFNKNDNFLNKSVQEDIIKDKELEEVNMNQKKRINKNFNFEDNQNDISKESINLYCSKINEDSGENEIKIEFANQLLENKELLESVEEEALLATVKYLFEIHFYKKCVNLCL